MNMETYAGIVRREDVNGINSLEDRENGKNVKQIDGRALSPC